MAVMSGRKVSAVVHTLVPLNLQSHIVAVLQPHALYVLRTAKCLWRRELEPRLLRANSSLGAQYEQRRWRNATVGRNRQHEH